MLLWHVQHCVVIQSLNSLWPSDAMWQHICGSTLAQVMACCLRAPSHYLNQCSLSISEVSHSHESNFTVSYQGNILYNKFENYTFRVTALSPRYQWVKTKPYGKINLGHHWFRQWLVAWRHQAITWTNVHFSLVRCGIHLSPRDQWVKTRVITNQYQRYPNLILSELLPCVHNSETVPQAGNWE